MRILLSVLLCVIFVQSSVVIYNSTAAGDFCDWLPANGDDRYWKCELPQATNSDINSCGGSRTRNCWTMPDTLSDVNASLYSPVFNFTLYTNLSISFNVIWDLETSYDAVNFGFNPDSQKNLNSPLPPTGENFTVLGSPNWQDPNHWYNSWVEPPFMNGEIPYLKGYTGSGFGWSGSNKMNFGDYAGLNLSSQGWVKANRKLGTGPNVKYGSAVQFRFSYSSDEQSSSGMDGFAFDEFVVYGDLLPVVPVSSTPDAIQTPPSPSSNAGAIAGGIIGGLAGIAIIAVVIFFILRLRSRKEHSQVENPENSEKTGDIPMSQVQRKKYSELAGELQLNDVVVGEVLGRGNFGVVHKGLWQETTPVALKGITGEDLDEFLAEAVITKQLNHPNCVRFLGLCMQEEKIFIVTEFMARGSLLNLLRSESQVESSRLIQMAIDICAGMKYLESKKVIHRDLSARNVLVDDHDVVKISDFGMSRTQSGDYYQITNKVMPVKWTAPEVITHGKYTYTSDVWSFGVVLHEIFTLGGEPYPGMTNTEVISKLATGWRMPRSEQCPIEIYQLMQRCWAANPAERPSFLDLRKALETYKDEVAAITLSMNPDASRKYDDASYSAVHPSSETNADGSKLYSVPIELADGSSPSSNPTYSAPIVAPERIVSTKYEDLNLSFKKD